MEQRRFGSTELLSSAIGFGTWQMSVRQYGHIDIVEASRAAQRAIDHGITLFDTAETYGPFTAEKLLGQALGRRRQDVVIVTKVGFTFRQDPDDPRFMKTHERDSSASNIIKHAEDCLRRLNTDYIDLLLIHFHDHRTPQEETIAGLEKLQAAGKIRCYGVSNYSELMMAAAKNTGASRRIKSVITFSTDGWKKPSCPIAARKASASWLMARWHSAC